MALLKQMPVKYYQCCVGCLILKLAGSFLVTKNSPAFHKTGRKIFIFLLYIGFQLWCPAGQRTEEQGRILLPGQTLFLNQI